MSSATARIWTTRCENWTIQSLRILGTELIFAFVQHVIAEADHAHAVDLEAAAEIADADRIADHVLALTAEIVAADARHLVPLPMVKHLEQREIVTAKDEKTATARIAMNAGVSAKLATTMMIAVAVPAMPTTTPPGMKTTVEAMMTHAVAKQNFNHDLYSLLVYCIFPSANADLVRRS